MATKSIVDNPINSKLPQQKINSVGNSAPTNNQ
jgi:hypothetical protein